MQLGKLDGYEAVELVEEQFQLGQLLLVEVAHIESVSYTHQGLETELLISEDEEQEASHKVHALAVFNFWIEKRICLEYIIQNLWLHDVPKIMK